jgi:hypothetical protein
MDLLYNMYVYKLQKGQFLLYANFCSEFNEFNEDNCSFLYQEIVKNNPISSLDHIKNNVAGWQVDAFVHTYMHKYGIENIRGGRYNKIDLSEEDKNEISNAIKFFTFGLENQLYQLSIYNDYKKNVQMSNIYRDNIETYDKINIFRQRFEINRNIIYDLEWLLGIIKNQTDNFLTISDRYYKIMNNLSTVYAQFVREVEDAREYIDRIHLEYNNCAKCNLIYAKPYTFFDCRVIPNERVHTKYLYANDMSLICAIKIFELSIYYLINREDEHIFDLSLINLQENKDKLFISERHLKQML